MLLSDWSIQDEMEAGTIIIDPYAPSQLQPASYDVRLEDVILIPRGQPTHYSDPPEPYYVAAFDPSTAKQPLSRLQLPEHGSPRKFYLPPGGVALGCTTELITLHPDAPLAADIAGCSSLGRWWLAVHMTAGFIDPGWSGRLTLELFNASPWWLHLWAGMRIAQIRFWRMGRISKRSYLDVGHYAGAVTVMPADYHG